MAAARLDASPTLALAARLASFAIVCAVLYWGQVVLMPVALAVLVAFVLSPAVTRLHRVGAPRWLAVFAVVGLATGVLGALGWVAVSELGGLVEELPAYRENIRAKIADVREMTSGGTLERVQTTIEDLSEDIEREVEAGESEAEEEPVRVQVTPPLLEDLGSFAPLLETIATAGLVVLLSIFVLLKREDLRNRLVSLIGPTSLVTTTKAFAEAGQRISRYLLMQFVINATMGLAVWLGLYLIGVPYSALWGLAAAVLRYIPYIGPWIAALMPITVSIVTSPDWTGVMLVLALFVTLELLSNNIMEPLLYGQSVGLSPIAVILAMIFWTWLWGPIGLVLATPLTVCFVVLGKYVPGLGVLDRLLGDGPALPPHLAIYQRLLARDEDEAGEVLERYAAEHSLTQTCDELLVRVLLALKHDLAHDRITAEEGAFVATALGAMAEDLSSPAASRGAGAHPLLIGFPSRDRLDAIALELLQALLRESDAELEVLSPDALIGERIAALERRAPVAICIPSLPPGDLTTTRNLCKRLKEHLAEPPLLVGRMAGAEAQDRTRERLRAAGAQQVHGSLAALRDALLAIARSARSASRSGAAAAPAGPSSVEALIASRS